MKKTLPSTHLADAFAARREITQAAAVIEAATRAKLNAQARYGRALRAVRKQSGMSLRSAAQASGVSAPFLSDFERGRRMMLPATERALLGALGILAEKKQRRAT